MSGWGIRVRAPGGVTVIFDSTAEQVMFPIEERAITGASVGTTGLTYTYPAFAGKKISAFMTSPYSVGDTDGWSVLSCRISYPSGIPTVSVFVDNNTHGYPICDGYLVVLFTGAPQ